MDLSAVENQLLEGEEEEPLPDKPPVDPAAKESPAGDPVEAFMTDVALIARFWARRTITERGKGCAFLRV